MASTATLETQLRELLDVLGRTSDGMVAVDSDLRIVGWNRAATELLGYAPEDALGRPCFDILAWRDRCGDPVCDGACAALRPGDPDEVIETREVLGRSEAGKTLWLNVTTIVPPPDLRRQCRLVHLVREVGLPPELERLVAERLRARSEPDDAAREMLEALTPRERQVLHLLTEGLEASLIAERLVLSPATVRNHIQHILRKLGVHSRAAAVALALRAER